MEPPTPTLKATTPDDLFTVVPYMLGFHPIESLVALQIDGKRVGAVARVDIDGPPELVARALGPLFERFASSDFILVAYCRDRHHGEAVLDAAESRLGRHRVVDTLMTDGVRGWSLFYDDDGWVLPPPDELLCAEAVFAGLAPMDDRLAIARLVDGPAPDRLPTLRELFEAAADAQSSSTEPWMARLDRLLDIGLADAGALAEVDVAELAIMVARIEWRDHAWTRMTRIGARAHKELWLRVVEITPDEWAVPVLCLLGFASWLDGGGALVVSCSERAWQLDPGYTMLQLLDDINEHAIPPSVWDAMNQPQGEVA
ncbi:MAG TPA: DUF4192 domain-containing protein [Propionibacteriaceae bacterium]|nr:DUF4192 domain-containing protein [Propionibacteriaceae bacterium]